MNIELQSSMNPQSKTAVYIDAANMFYSQKTMNFKLDYRKLYRFFDMSFNIRSISYYTGYDPQNTSELSDMYIPMEKLRKKIAV